jgi:hypothetical protein
LILCCTESFPAIAAWASQVALHSKHTASLLVACARNRMCCGACGCRVCTGLHVAWGVLHVWTCTCKPVSTPQRDCAPHRASFMCHVL